MTQFLSSPYPTLNQKYEILNLISDEGDTASVQLGRLIGTNHLVAIKRIQYSIIFIVASIVLVTECKKCLDKFLARETGTADTYQETLGVGIT